MTKERRILLSSLIVAWILIIIPFTSFGSLMQNDGIITTRNAPDYWPTDGWLTSTPEEQGMNSTILDNFWEITAPLRSFLVIRNGYIVYEEYETPNYNDTTLKPIYSVTKSFLSALVGMAFEDGNITSIDEFVVDYFTDRTIVNLDADKQSITIEHLLSMTSGFEWDIDTDGDAMRASPDWIQYVLDKPMAYPPGGTYYYTTGNSHLLSAIVNHTTGIPTLTYADTRLFQPLGISDYEWRLDPDGLAEGGSGLNLTARDMAKLGFLWLNNGTWDSEQLVPSTWVTASTEVHASDEDEDYGYHWRVNPPLDAYYAFGYRDLGQYVWVQPKNDLIAVFTIESQWSPLPHISTYILPAIISTTTPTTTPTTPPAQLDLQTIGLIAGAVVVVVIALEVFRRRR